MKRNLTRIEDKELLRIRKEIIKRDQMRSLFFLSLHKKVMLYVFHDGEYFAIVNDNLEIRRVKDINRASYWINKSNAKSWEKTIKINHPKMELKPAGLTLIEK